MDSEDIFVRATAPAGDTAAMPKAMLIFAHPDDETVALGSRMSRFGASHLIHITDGAPRDGQDSRAHGFASLDAYRQARAMELSRVLDVAGIGEISRECLEIPDQEATLDLRSLTRAILRRLRMHQPQIIFTHPYEGGHPDHDACAFAVHHAAALLRKQGGPVPVIAEAAFYHDGPQGIATSTFLPITQRVPEKRYLLSPDEQAYKRRLLGCFPSQRETLSCFSVASESYRIAPSYNFSRPPHPAPVLYDRFPWGMTSQRFCQLAQDAEDVLAAESRLWQ